MMNNETRIRSLLTRYDEVLITEAEEHELRELLATTTDLPADLQAAALLFEGFSALADEQMPRTIPLRPTKSRVVQRWAWTAVAAAIVIGCFVALQALRTPYCFINGRPVYDAEEALMYTDCLAELERLDHSVALFDRMMPLREASEE